MKTQTLVLKARVNEIRAVNSRMRARLHIDLDGSPCDGSEVTLYPPDEFVDALASACARGDLVELRFKVKR